MNNKIQPTDYHLFSGGAKGADSQFEIIGKEFGLTQFNHYWYKKKNPFSKQEDEISEEDYQEGILKIHEVNKILKRKNIDKYMHLLARNWCQVKYSDATYAISTINNNKVDNVNYIGKISKESLPYLYSKCDVGLNSYGFYSNVEMSDKFYDYTAAGLAVLNSLTGEVKDFVDKYQLGCNYTAGDINSFQRAVEIIIINTTLNQNKINSYKLGTYFDQKKQLNNFTNFLRDLG